MKRDHQPVERINVPDRFVRLAAMRTDGMIGWWAMTQTWAQNSVPSSGPMPLANLVRSAYLQGVEDAVAAIDRRPSLLEMVQVTVPEATP